MGSGLTNSMMGSSGMGASKMNTSSFANAKHDSVFKLLSGCTREEGEYFIWLLIMNTKYSKNDSVSTTVSVLFI